MRQRLGRKYKNKVEEFDTVVKKLKQDLKALVQKRKQFTEQPETILAQPPRK